MPTVSSPAPIPTVTVTGTVKVIQEPDPTPLADHLQGWGAVLAVIAALGIALRGWRRESAQRKQDQNDAGTQRNQDRADADRRLRDEREAGDRRLQLQLDEQRASDRRQFIAEQLQKAANLWSQGQVAQLPGVLVAIPDQYATILRYLVRGEDYNDIAGFPPLSYTTLAALEQQLVPRGLVNHGVETLLLAKMAERERNLEKEGKSKHWGRMHPRAAELYRGGYDYRKIKHAWLFEEIGDNIAEVFRETEPAAANESPEANG